MRRQHAVRKDKDKQTAERTLRLIQCCIGTNTVSSSRSVRCTPRISGAREWIGTVRDLFTNVIVVDLESNHESLLHGALKPTHILQRESMQIITSCCPISFLRKSMASSFKDDIHPIFLLKSRNQFPEPPCTKLFS